VVARDSQDRRPERLEQRSRTCVLVFAAAVREVTARDDQFGLLCLDEREECGLYRRILRCAHVEIRDVEEAGWHGRWRL
jgi:hypothetical protein